VVKDRIKLIKSFYLAIIWIKQYGLKRSRVKEYP